jgi:hypothetical protein
VVGRHEVSALHLRDGGQELLWPQIGEYEQQ